MRINRRLALVVFVATTAAVAARESRAALVSFTSETAWSDAVQEFAFIDFLGYSEPTIITNQYSSLGVTFIGGDDFVWNKWSLYPTDGWGMSGGFLSGGVPLPIVLEFDAPRYAIAANFKGWMGFELYLNDALVAVSPPFSSGLNGNFCGVISDVPFDAVTITGPANGIPNLDNLFFGSAVPAPSPVLLVLAAGASCRRRSRVRANR